MGKKWTCVISTSHISFPFDVKLNLGITFNVGLNFLNRIIDTTKVASRHDGT